MSFSVKTYTVQKADGDIIAVKLRFDDAHQIAKAYAPCRIIFALADKGPGLNVDQPNCNQLQTGRPSVG